MTTELPILYKYTTRNQVQQWQIFVDGDRFYTQEGLTGGTITQSAPTVCVGKNTGKANATSPEEQAIKEAKAKWDKKVAGGYNEVLSDEAKFFAPMLAQELSKYTKLLFTVPTFIQPKLDGVRAINQNNTLTSRNGKPFITCPHLYQDQHIFDGELYNHEYHNDFNRIISLVKRGSPTDEELAETKEKVQYWVYDLPSHDGVFSERYDALVRLQRPSSAFVLVPTYQVHSIEEIENYHIQFLAEGYEGSMIRLDRGGYENKRSKQLLKKKDFIDEEFLIIGAEEGVGSRAGTVGAFVLQHDTDPDKTFNSNVKGEFSYVAELWRDRDKYINTKATVKYFNRTPIQEDGSGDLPRFPYIVKLNREAYE